MCSMEKTLEPHPDAHSIYIKKYAVCNSILETMADSRNLMQRTNEEIRGFCFPFDDDLSRPGEDPVSSRRHDHLTFAAHSTNFVGLMPDSFAFRSMSALYPTRSNHSSMTAKSALNLRTSSMGV